jgi:hypothetical protein
MPANITATATVRQPVSIDRKIGAATESASLRDAGRRGGNHVAALEVHQQQ